MGGGNESFGGNLKLPWNEKSRKNQCALRIFILKWAFLGKEIRGALFPLFLSYGALRTFLGDLYKTVLTFDNHQQPSQKTNKQKLFSQIKLHSEGLQNLGPSTFNVLLSGVDSSDTT